jgi:transcriptional regulator with XRE-family HTH domain
MSKLLEILSKNMKLLRKEREIKSAEKFAEMTEIDVSSIRKYEAGTTWPSDDRLEKIAEALGVDPCHLLCDRDDLIKNALEIVVDAAGFQGKIQKKT